MVVSAIAAMAAMALMTMIIRFIIFLLNKRRFDTVFVWHKGALAIARYRLLPETGFCFKCPTCRRPAQDAMVCLPKNNVELVIIPMRKGTCMPAPRAGGLRPARSDMAFY